MQIYGNAVGRSKRAWCGMAWYDTLEKRVNKKHGNFLLENKGVVLS